MSEPCGTAYENLMEQHFESKIISLDPNIRPNFIQVYATHKARINRMIAMSDIVKVSDDDLDWLAQGESHETLMQNWLEGDTSIVLMTKGADGIDIYTDGGFTTVPAQKAVVVDTVGAGDTFNAGFLSGLRRSRFAEQSWFEGSHCGSNRRCSNTWRQCCRHDCCSRWRQSSLEK